MRFSLRTLLLMFPTFLLARFLAAFVYQMSRGMGHSRWSVEHQKMRFLDSVGRTLYIENRQPVDVAQVNAWLAGKIPYSTPKYRGLANFLSEFDLQTQQVHCVALDKNQQPLPDAKIAVHLGFYSVGKDGKSATHGLDPDDFNSWEEHAHPYHREKENLRHQIEILQILPFTLAAVLVMGKIWFGKSRANEVTKEQ